MEKMITRRETKQTPDIYNRLMTTMRGGKPDRWPFCARTELWYSARSRAGTLPAKYMEPSADREPSVISIFTVPIRKDFVGARLTDIHRDLGMGQQLQGIAHSRRLRGVEVKLSLDDKVFFHAKDPIVDYFPRLFDLLLLEQPGDTTAEFITPKGTLIARSTLVEDMIANGTIPVMTEHPVKGDDDFPALEYIYTHAEFVPKYDWVYDNQKRMGHDGFVAAMIDRIPWQKMALDLIGEVPTFYALYENPRLIEKVMALMDEVTLNDIKNLEGFDWPYIQFDDNLDGMITNPKLFPDYCIPYYQKYIDMFHAQGKKVGSHTDGNLKRLVPLLPETGLDVFESFTPFPLTELTFQEAFEAWKGKGPLIWGGIPSSILQPDTSQEDFEKYIANMLEVVGSSPHLFGVADLVTSDNIIERVRYIAEQIEAHEID